jgi:hypothetical protein
MLLTDADLHDLTGYHQPKRQARVLDEHGIRYVLRADGKIRVTWEQVNQPGERGKRQRPNFEAARG